MKYYSTQRPVGPGTFPKPKDNRVLDLWNFDKPIFCEQINREAWGYINYEKPLTEKQAADYELVPSSTRCQNPAVKHIVQILMERDAISEQEAQRMVDDCRQQLLSEAVPSGDSDLAEEILSEELGLEPDYLVDLLF